MESRLSTIIHDAYTMDAYVQRRVGFLSKQLEWKSHPALFPKVRREALEVFQGQEATTLAVEAIRARELECEVEPLLPFPTTSNTETLDNFASYPEIHQHTPTPSPPPAASSIPAQPSSTTTSDAGISAVSGRAINVPVKARARGHEDGTPSETDSETSSESGSQNDKDGTEDASPTPQPAAKRPRLILKVSPPPRLTIKLASTKKAPEQGRSTNNASAPNNKNDDLDSRANAKAMKDSTDRITRISRGEIVPKSQAEARQAQTLRKQRLLSTTENKKSGKKASRNAPDMMPEFFEKANFSRAERDEGPVRCVCGDVDDSLRPGEEWIGCSGDDCGGCWQHVGCLGDAVSSDKAERESEDYEYFCHLCDPFRHRKTLQKLRRGEIIQH